MLIPVILSGGAGTRLRPVAREGHPKHIMKLADGQSLLLKKSLRVANVIQVGEILTVANRDSFFVNKEELANANLGECSRSTQKTELPRIQASPLCRPAMGCQYRAGIWGGFKIKRIEVKPGGSLSLPMHHYHSHIEHWNVMSCTARVVNGEREILSVSTNQLTFL